MYAAEQSRLLVSTKSSWLLRPSCSSKLGDCTFVFSSSQACLHDRRGWSTGRKEDKGAERASHFQKGEDSPGFPGPLTNLLASKKSAWYASLAWSIGYARPAELPSRVRDMTCASSRIDDFIKRSEKGVIFMTKTYFFFIYFPVNR